ncbi:MAG: hypothetical protein HOV79_19295, partial [Hamadaea sp.]|nr:hypothetical protein [Hamadaea sp.]
MTSARSLLKSLDPLPYPRRVRLLAQHARQSRGTAELRALVAEFAQGDSAMRDIGVFLAGAAQDIEALRPFLTDPDAVIRARAVKMWLVSGAADPAEVAQLLQDASYETRQVIYRHLRRKRSRRQTPGLADAIVDAVHARFGEAEAGRLLPACAPQTVARLLPQLGSGSTWNATVGAHPQQALAEARRQLAELPQAQRASWWSWVGYGVLTVARTHPDTVLDLLAEYAPATSLPGLPAAHAQLAKAYPQRMLELMLDRRRSDWLRRAPLSRALLAALATLPDDRLVALAIRLREANRLPELLVRLAPSRRGVIFEGAFAGVDRAQAMLPDALLEALPWRLRVAEAQRMRRLERAATTPVQVRLAGFLPWEQAQPELLAAAKSPVADERAYAYEQLARCAARSGDPAVVTELAVLFERLRNEQ